MSQYVQAFNKPVDFDTSQVQLQHVQVTGMQSMFRYAQAFYQPINFDTSNVQTMRRMFYNK